VETDSADVIRSPGTPPDLATAEDVVQDAFEQLHRRWRTLRQQSSALDGQPGHLTKLPAYPVPMYAFVVGIALSPDGTLLAVSSTYRVGPHRGTVIAQIAEMPAAGSGPVRVLRTETARYTVNTKGYLDDASQVLSLDPSGRYALVQCFQFGWLDLDLGRFTPLPRDSPGWGAW
jgi:hypothetical protein